MRAVRMILLEEGRSKKWTAQLHAKEMATLGDNIGVCGWIPVNKCAARRGPRLVVFGSAVGSIFVAWKVFHSEAFQSGPGHLRFDSQRIFAHDNSKVAHF